MRKLRYQLVDVFTNERFGGNQLAVFTNGRGLSSETMQRIAKELNLSETTFVLPPEDSANDWKVRIFTPGTELPMAGHPTVGTAYVLAREHLVAVSEAKPGIRFEEKVGVIPVTFSFQDGAVSLIKMQQPNPTFELVFENRLLAAEMLGLGVSDLEDYPVEVVSSGVPFLFVPVKTLQAVEQIKVRPDMVERALDGLTARMVFVFTRETVQPDSTVHSRMFGHLNGIPEDPATGAASGPLGSYLVKYGIVTDNPAVMVSEQGLEMGRPSFIHIEIGQANGVINFVSVGGQCVAVGEGMIEIE
jgi:trans-2,3-dihydro-3-hydroxyanthranilate isomerase